MNYNHVLFAFFLFVNACEPAVTDSKTLERESDSQIRIDIADPAQIERFDDFSSIPKPSTPTFYLSVYAGPNAKNGDTFQCDIAILAFQKQNAVGRELTIKKTLRTGANERRGTDLEIAMTEEMRDPSSDLKLKISCIKSSLEIPRPIVEPIVTIPIERDAAEVDRLSFKGSVKDNGVSGYWACIIASIHISVRINILKEEYRQSNCTWKAVVKYTDGDTIHAENTTTVAPAGEVYITLGDFNESISFCVGNIDSLPTIEARGVCKNTEGRAEKEAILQICPTLRREGSTYICPESTDSH